MSPIPYRDEEATARMHELYGGRATIGSDDDEFLREDGDGTGAVEGSDDVHPDLEGFRKEMEQDVKRQKDKGKKKEKAVEDNGKEKIVGEVVDLDADIRETQASIKAATIAASLGQGAPIDVGGANEDEGEIAIDQNEVDDDITLTKEQIEGIMAGKLNLLGLLVPEGLPLAAGHYVVSVENGRIHKFAPGDMEYAGDTNKLLPSLHALINSCLAIRNERLPEGSVVYQFPANINTPGEKGTKKMFRMLDPEEARKDAIFGVKDTSRLYITFIHKETREALCRTYHGAASYNHKDVQFMSRLSHWRGQQILRLTGQHKFSKDDDLLWTLAEQNNMEIILASTIASHNIRGTMERQLERINFDAVRDELIAEFSGGQGSPKFKAAVSVKAYCDVVPGQANRRHLNCTRPAFLHTAVQTEERAKETFVDIKARIDAFRASRVPIARQLNKADWEKFAKKSKKKAVPKPKTEDAPRDDDNDSDGDDDAGDDGNGAASAKKESKGKRKEVAKASPAKPRGQKRKVEAEPENDAQGDAVHSDNKEDLHPTKISNSKKSRGASKRRPRPRMIISDDEDDLREVSEPELPGPSKKNKGKQPASEAPAKPRRSARQAAPMVPKAVREHNKKIVKSAKDLERRGKAYLRSAKSRRGFDERLHTKGERTYPGKKASRALFQKYSFGADGHTEENEAPPAIEPLTLVSGLSKRSAPTNSPGSPSGPNPKRVRKGASRSVPSGSTPQRAKRASPTKPATAS